MGTLFDQPARSLNSVTKESVTYLLTDAMKISNELGATLDQVLMAYKIKELERRNTLFVQNGDTFDEQMMGLGEILQSISEKLNDK